MFNRLSKLSKLQKAILQIGLESLWFHEPLDKAFRLARNEWSAKPTFYIPIRQSWLSKDAYEPSDYIGFDLTLLLRDYFKVTDDDEIWDPGLTARHGSDRRERFAKAKASISRAMKRLAERGLIEKPFYHKWRLTAEGEKVAAALFPKTRKATRKQLKAAREDGLKGPAGWRPKE